MPLQKIHACMCVNNGERHFQETLILQLAVVANIGRFSTQSLYPATECTHLSTNTSL